MNADRTSSGPVPGLLAGLAAFVGSIAGLFAVARLTHAVMMAVKDPDRFSAETMSQATLIVCGVVLLAATLAAGRLLMHRHGPDRHDPVEHGYSGRPA